MNPLNQMTMGQIPVIKNYTINTNGPTDNHLKLGMIYEDVLPGKEMSSSANTLSERITLHNYIRSTMFSKGDGSETSLQSTGGKSSILSQIKFMDLNPYSSYKFSNNPYRGLPDNFLIYRSCYPIRNDTNTNSVTCARGSMGMNVRIYKMTEEEYSVNQFKKTQNDFNTWRDINYYTYVRESIIKNKVVPNFVSMFGYYLIEKSMIDFDKIKTLQGKFVGKDEYFLKNPKMTNPTNPLLNFVPSNTSQNMSNILNQVERMVNPKSYSGKALVALTEAPLYNLFAWASKTYSTSGNIRTMISSGYHNEKVWYSILFQIIVALYTMQKFGIYFNNFSPEDNIFIKDLNMHGNVTSYWRYRVDGIEYYIPNYGYLVMIDSSFKDMNGGIDKKIIGKPFGEDVQNNVFNLFLATFNSNLFSKDFEISGGVQPPEEIKSFINNINKEASVDKIKNIGIYLQKYMGMFVNNRAGTLLKENEIPNIRINERDFVNGQIVLYEHSAKAYKFAIYIKQKEDNSGMAYILTRDDPTKGISLRELPINSLSGYSKTDPIIQNFKAGEALMNEEDLLETYIL
jgi:hypothetical protein